jgi:hypothetical protein
MTRLSFVSLGDSEGLTYNNGHVFSTYDHTKSSNCGNSDHGGWWYSGCTYANLNGQYFTPGSDHGEPGVTYRDFKGTESLKTTKMMFRRV